MRKKRFIAKALAIVLLLVFVQKAGAGLYLHNWLHQRDCSGSLSYNAIQVNAACNCIDDFSLPLDKPADPVITIIQVPAEIFSFNYTSPLFFCAEAYNSLRGPPAV